MYGRAKLHHSPLEPICISLPTDDNLLKETENLHNHLIDDHPQVVEDKLDHNLKLPSHMMKPWLMMMLEKKRPVEWTLVSITPIKGKTIVPKGVSILPARSFSERIQTLALIVGFKFVDIFKVRVDEHEKKSKRDYSSKSEDEDDGQEDGRIKVRT